MIYLFNSIKEIDIRIVEVLIYKYAEGIFYAYLVIEYNGKNKKNRCASFRLYSYKPLRANAPIFVYEYILDEVGNIFEDGRMK